MWCRVQFEIGWNVYVNKEKLKEIEEFYHNVDNKCVFKDIKFTVSDNCKLEDIELDDYVGKVPDDGELFANLLSKAITSGEIVVYYIEDGAIWGRVVKPNETYDVTITATYQEDGKTIEVPLPAVI